MRVGVNQALQRLARQSVLWIKIAVLVFAGLSPALMAEQVHAAQLSPRKLTIGTSESGATTSYEFAFQPPTSVAIQGIIFQFCDTPLGGCALPTSLDISAASVSDEAFDDATPQDAWAKYTSTDLGDCTDHDNGASSTQLCAERTDTDPESVAEKTLTFSSIDNPTLSGTSYTFYVRITLYSDTSFATDEHTGTVAGAIVRQLTSVGRVAERLEFCVGGIEDEPTNFPDDCSTNFPSTTLVDLGIIDDINVTAAPVDPSASNANLANDSYGILMVNTNASGGVVIAYFPEEATNVSNSDTDQLRSFRVLPADCSPTVTSETDQCFESVGAGGGPIASPNENFGMAVACINQQGTTENFKPANGGTIGSAYIGDNDFDESTQLTIADNCENEPVTSYTWGFDDSGSPATLASTATSTNKVVDDEAIKIRFGAIASSTTPTGTYQVTTTYIATATF